jgi:hypothetical protein
VGIVSCCHAGFDILPANSVPEAILRLFLSDNKADYAVHKNREKREVLRKKFLPNPFCPPKKYART